MIFDRLMHYSAGDRAAAAERARNICRSWYKKDIPEKAEGAGELIQRLAACEDHALRVWLEEEAARAVKRYEERSGLHGVDHILRVCMFARLLAQKLALGESDRRLLFLAALYHDIGRKDDSPDPYHGFRGARMLREIPHTFCPKDEGLLSALIAAHPFRDGDDEDILSFFGDFDGEDKNRFRLLLSVLKDADALDRFRLSDQSLKAHLLRHEESRALIPAACELVQLTCREKEESSPEFIDWDQAADYYGAVSRLALPYARMQLKEAGLEPGSTLLDVGAGCGRYSLAAAALCRHVTAFDKSRKMLDYCSRWCREEGITNVETVWGDWKDPEAAKALGRFDYVLASRTHAMQDIDRLSALADKKVILVNWANAPSFPDLTVRLCGKENLLKYPLGSPSRPARQYGYNCYFREAYKAGYEPNVRILADGLYKEFDSRAEAGRELWELARGNVKEGCEEKVLQNFESFYEMLPEGRLHVVLESRAALIWWKV